MSFFVDKFLGGGGREKGKTVNWIRRSACLSRSWREAVIVKEKSSIKRQEWRRGGALRQCVSASGTIHESKRVRLIDRLFRAIDVFHSLPRQETKIIPVKPWFTRPPQPSITDQFFFLRANRFVKIVIRRHCTWRNQQFPRYFRLKLARLSNASWNISILDGNDRFARKRRIARPNSLDTRCRTNARSIASFRGIAQVEKQKKLAWHCSTGFFHLQRESSRIFPIENRGLFQ